MSLSLTESGCGRFEGALDLARRELAERLGRLSQRDLAKITTAMTHLRGVFDDDAAGRVG